jgi:hypothetical protein
MGVGDPGMASGGHRDISEVQRQSLDKRVDDEDGDAVGHECIIASR